MESGRGSIHMREQEESVINCVLMNWDARDKITNFEKS